MYGKRGSGKKFEKDLGKFTEVIGGDGSMGVLSDILMQRRKCTGKPE